MNIVLKVSIYIHEMQWNICCIRRVYSEGMSRRVCYAKAAVWHRGGSSKSTFVHVATHVSQYFGFAGFMATSQRPDVLIVRNVLVLALAGKH